jgi:3-oxoacyl-[acyl-carrier protein] reductase
MAGSRRNFRESDVASQIGWRSHGPCEKCRSKETPVAGAKVVIVTGASEGIGAAAAAQLARDGYIVVIHHHERPAEAQRMVSHIEGFGGMARVVEADITDPGEVCQMFDTVERQLGGVDVLVNAAETMEAACLSDVDDRSFDRQLAVNLRGTFHTLREAARRMRRGGRIINISSTAATDDAEGHAAYAASKAGIDSMTRALSRELAGRGIVVNAVALAPSDATASLATRSERARTDVAALIAFLAGPDCACVSGVVIRSDVAAP